MSNPAVIILDNASSKKGKFKRFVIEDNIGESIHLHIDDMRVDFSIKEFLEFSSMVRESLNEINFLCGYKLENFEKHFLKECAGNLSDLIDIKIEEIELSKLKCIVHSNYKGNLNLSKLVPIPETPAFRYLSGDKKGFLRYGQYNYFSINNENRLLEKLESIKINGYPFKDRYIVLFNGEDIVRDGQHRAAILAYLYGLEYKAKFMRFYFKGVSHLTQIKKNNFKVSIKWLLEKVCSVTKNI